MKNGDGTRLRNFSNLPFVSYSCASGQATVSSDSPSALCDPDRLEVDIRGRSGGRRWLSQQASLLSTATTYSTLPRNRNLYAKLEDVICDHHVFNLCKTVLVCFCFVFLMKVLPLDL